VADLEFLANMNISPLTVEQLKQHGWNIIRVSEIMKSNSTDKEVLAYARDHNKILITQDLDFSMLLAVGGHSKPSVINLRLEKANPDYVATRIMEVVPAMVKELAEGVVVSVDETSVRYRNLPITATE
jgi:predicted nuclease of predicted toxin-antitoxin system